MIAAGLFAMTAGNAAGGNGLFSGNPGQVSIQLLAIVVTIVFSFAGTYIIARLLNVSVGLRVTPMEEEVGLDISSHGERSY